MAQPLLADDEGGDGDGEQRARDGQARVPARPQRLLAAALDRPAGAIRFYLFCGQDPAQIRGLGQRLLAGLQAEKFVIPVKDR